MNYLDNSLLIETYKKALELKLELDFIQILERELYSRGITIETLCSFNN